jgi:hypothetical protein
VVDKRTIIEFLVREGVNSGEISEIMQIRCKEKKRIGNTAGDKKSSETTKETKMDENSNSSIISLDGKDNSESIKEETSPKRNAKRTVKEKVVKYGSDDDDEDQENIDENISDYMGSDSETEKKIKKSKPKAKAQVKFDFKVVLFLIIKIYDLLVITREEKCFECSYAKSAK